jgi:hypothetical protein
MKAGWQTKTLGEVCDFINGLWTGEKPPFVKVGVIRNTNFTKEGTLGTPARPETAKSGHPTFKLTYDPAFNPWLGSYDLRSSPGAKL